MTKLVEMPLWEQLTLYLGAAIGVLFSSVVTQFQAGKITTVEFTFPTVIISLIIALLIIPQVFEKLPVDTTAPLLVRFALCVQNGVFWYVIFNSLGKAI